MRLGSNVRVWGTTLFEFDRRCTIVIGDNTLINGSSHGYHLSQYRNSKIKCKNNAYLHIGSNCRIHGALIHAGGKIIIGDNVLIASGVKIFDYNGHEKCVDNPSDRLSRVDDPKPITIGDNVWICANALILPGSYIESGAIVGAGTIVNGRFEARQ